MRKRFQRLLQPTVQRNSFDT